MEAEKTNLGDNADARIEAVDLWANKFFPDEMSDAVLQIGQTSKGIEALEFIMSKLGSASVGANTAPVTGNNQDALATMMNDERYWNPAKRDAGYVKKVQEGFSQLYK